MKLLLENWREYLAEEQGRKVNIFLDMDGVLVDFPSALKDHIKKIYSANPEEVHPNSKRSRAALRRLQKLNLSPEAVDELYDETEAVFREGGNYNNTQKMMSRYILKALLGNKPLWLAMNKLEGADTVVQKAFDLADNVFVLTAQVDETSEEAKKEWIANHFPQINSANVNVDRDKGGRLEQLISRGEVGAEDLNILIDDRKHFLDSFINAGGDGVQYDFENPQLAFDELERLISH